MLACLRIVVAWSLLLASLCAVEAWRRRPMRVYTTADLHVVAPAELLAAGRLAARAQAIYERLQDDSGIHPERRLWLVLGTRRDHIAGFSSVVPAPLVFVNLAPAGTQSELFFGGAAFEPILVHELAHHLSNEDPSWTNRIFGRPLPSGPLSILTFLVTVPNHVTMPRFWHEGVAQWAETSYVPADRPWAGRGRAGLVHAIWRLDVAAEAVPPFNEWRLSQPDWPFGAIVYHYGVAYLRYLAAESGVDVWELLRAQRQRQIYMFREGSTALLGRNHHELLRAAERALIEEQEAAIATLRAQPLTELPRAHATRYLAGVPAWLPADENGRARPVAILRDILGDSDLASLATSHPRELEDGVSGLHLRAATDGTLAYEGRTLDGAARVCVWRAGDEERLGDLRVRFPAIAALGAGGYRLAGLEVVGDGSLRLALWDLRWPAGGDPVLGAQRVIATEHPAWDPTFDADGGRLAWLTSDESGMALHTLDLTDPAAEPVERWRVAARLAHPAFTPDGAVVVCSDHSGVFNAYRVTADGVAAPLTHTLGAVTAAVPDPTGERLALRVLDHEGWYVAVIPMPAARSDALPAIAIDWLPAAAAGDYALPAADPEAEVAGRGYHAITRIRPQWWTPTIFLSTRADVDTGIGIHTRFADPLGRMLVDGRVGVANPGADEREAVVGSLGWTWRRWPVDLGLRGWREVQTYDDLFEIAGGFEYDYSETRTGGALVVGRSYFGGGLAWSAEAGFQRHEELDEEVPAGFTPVGPPVFVGDEHYAGIGVALGAVERTPRSLGPVSGWSLRGGYRFSGFGGDLERHQGTLGAAGWLPIWRRKDVVLELGASLGTSDGDDTLQRTFILGDGDNRAVGDHLVGYSAALRVPVWRPFRYWGTAPIAFRQLAVEPFVLGNRVNNDELFADEGEWYHIAGVRIISEWELDLLRLTPGLVIGRELDHDEDWFVAISFLGL